MRPFSAFTYFRNNRLRVLVLILMMSFITVCFIGGMYVDNPGEIFRITLEGENRFLVLDTRGTSNDSIEQYRELQGKLSSYLPEDISTIIYLNRYYEDFDSIMGFNCTTDHYIFQSAEDFELFKTRTGLVPEDVHLKNGETVMSEQLAESEDLEIGDPMTRTLPSRRAGSLPMQPKRSDRTILWFGRRRIARTWKKPSLSCHLCTIFSLRSLSSS